MGSESSEDTAPATFEGEGSALQGLATSAKAKTLSWPELHEEEYYEVADGLVFITKARWLLLRSDER